MSLAEFVLQLRNKWEQPNSQRKGVDWIEDSDDCSIPAQVVKTLRIDNKNEPRGFDFLHSCYRHNFGYGNYKKQKMFTAENREKVDEQFKKEMYDECDNNYRDLLRVQWSQCRSLARTYWLFVRLCRGGLCENAASMIDKFLDKLNPLAHFD